MLLSVVCFSAKLSFSSGSHSNKLQRIKLFQFLASKCFILLLFILLHKLNIVLRTLFNFLSGLLGLLQFGPEI